jgi:hypothetical protein
MGLITGKHDKFVKTPIGKNLHDMPEDRFTPDFHHGFGDYARFFG